MTDAHAAGWTRKLGSLVFIVFCFEIGVFLLVFPWLGPWENNWMADALPWFSAFWDNLYFRGSVSGLGFINVYIALLEASRLRRAI